MNMNGIVIGILVYTVIGILMIYRAGEHADDDDIAMDILWPLMVLVALIFAVEWVLVKMIGWARRK